MDSISSKNGGHDEEKDLFISRIGSDSLHVCRLCPGRRQGRFFFCGAGIRRKKDGRTDRSEWTHCDGGVSCGTDRMYAASFLSLIHI